MSLLVLAACSSTCRSSEPLELGRRALGLVLFASLGLVVGIYAETWDHTTFVTNIVILPLAFVGGVFYSVDVLPRPGRSSRTSTRSSTS